MKKFVPFLITLSLICIFSTTNASTLFTWDWTDSSNRVHNYTVVGSEDIKWDAAKDYVTSTFGGGYHLATITSQDEQDAMVSAFVPGALYGVHGEFWLGGIIGTNDSWAWDNGETWDYTNWHAREPSRDGKYVATWFRGGWNGEWNDEGRHRNIAGFIVEAPVPEPTTMVLFGLGLLGIAGVSRRKN